MRGVSSITGSIDEVLKISYQFGVMELRDILIRRIKEYIKKYSNNTRCQFNYASANPQEPPGVKLAAKMLAVLSHRHPDNEDEIQTFIRCLHSEWLEEIKSNQELKFLLGGFFSMTPHYHQAFNTNMKMLLGIRDIWSDMASSFVDMVIKRLNTATFSEKQKAFQTLRRLANGISASNHKLLTLTFIEYLEGNGFTTDDTNEELFRTIGCLQDCVSYEARDRIFDLLLSYMTNKSDYASMVACEVVVQLKTWMSAALGFIDVSQLLRTARIQNRTRIHIITCEKFKRLKQMIHPKNRCDVINYLLDLTKHGGAEVIASIDTLIDIQEIIPSEMYEQIVKTFVENFDNPNIGIIQLAFKVLSQLDFVTKKDYPNYLTKLLEIVQDDNADFNLRLTAMRAVGRMHEWIEDYERTAQKFLTIIINQNNDSEYRSVALQAFSSFIRHYPSLLGQFIQHFLSQVNDNTENVNFKIDMVGVLNKHCGFVSLKYHAKIITCLQFVMMDVSENHEYRLAACQSLCQLRQWMPGVLHLVTQREDQKEQESPGAALIPCLTRLINDKRERTNLRIAAGELFFKLMWMLFLDEESRVLIDDVLKEFVTGLDDDDPIIRWNTYDVYQSLIEILPSHIGAHLQSLSQPRFANIIDYYIVKMHVDDKVIRKNAYLNLNNYLPEMNPNQLFAVFCRMQGLVFDDMNQSDCATMLIANIYKRISSINTCTIFASELVEKITHYART